MAGGLECWSSRSSSRDDNDDVDVEEDEDERAMEHQVLMSSHLHRSEQHQHYQLQEHDEDEQKNENDKKDKDYSISTSSIQKRFHKLSRNVSDAISSLKNTLHFHFNSTHKLPQHFHSMPPSYAEAGFDMKDVLLHIRLMEQACLDDHPAILLIPPPPPSVAAAANQYKDKDICLEEEEANVKAKDHQHQPQKEGSHSHSHYYTLIFACNSSISWPTLSGALHSASIHCTQFQLFHKNTTTSTSTLGILHIPLQPAHHHQDEDLTTFKTLIHNALRSASASVSTSASTSTSATSRKPKLIPNIKLPFGLCGCQDNKITRNNPNHLGHIQLNHHLDHLNTTTTHSHSHSNTKIIQLPMPLPSSSFVVSVDEWQTVHTAGTDLVAKWLLNPDSLHFGDQLGPTSFKGVYKGALVSIEKLKGCHKGNPYTFQIRQDLLEFMTSGHPNFLTFYGVCVDDIHGLCVVTKFMEGGSVHDVIMFNKHKKQLQIKDVIRIAVDVAEGIKFMNDHGVPYQDLNTHRILLDRNWNACLGDMGIVTACKTLGDAMEYETHGYRWLAPELILKVLVRRG